MQLRCWLCGPDKGAIYTDGFVNIYKIIQKSFRVIRPPRYSSRDGHAKGGRVNRGRVTQVSVLLYRCSIAPFCCVCLGCCAADFGSSGRTYELPCTHTYSIYVYIIHLYMCIWTFLRIRALNRSFNTHRAHCLVTSLHIMHRMAGVCLMKCALFGRKQLWLVPVSLLMEARAGLAAVVENCCEHRVVYACRWWDRRTNTTESVALARRPGVSKW
jgi:hypothetical protein